MMPKHDKMLSLTVSDWILRGRSKEEIYNVVKQHKTKGGERRRASRGQDEMMVKPEGNSPKSKTQVFSQKLDILFSVTYRRGIFLNKICQLAS